jgi:protein-tyrosine phosphatase
MSANDALAANDQDFSMITERICVGNALAARNLDELKKRNVRHVLNCVPKLEVPNYHENEPTYQIVYKSLSLADQPHPRLNALPIFRQAIDFIDGALKSSCSEDVVLVHCVGGQNRSVTIVCAWLLDKGLASSVEHALYVVKSKRSLAKVNAVYRRQLGLFYELVEHRDSTQVTVK